jgi:hypothetical protein
MIGVARTWSRFSKGGHVLGTHGGFSTAGVFHALEVWDGHEIMRLFRERLLARLLERYAISQELAAKLLSWRHPGFSMHMGDAWSALYGAARAMAAELAPHDAPRRLLQARSVDVLAQVHERLVAPVSVDRAGVWGRGPSTAKRFARR